MLSIFLRSTIRSNIWFRSSSSSSLSSTKIISSRCLSFRTKYENQFHSHYHNNRWNRYSQSIINYSNQSKIFYLHQNELTVCVCGCIYIITGTKNHFITFFSEKVLIITQKLSLDRLDFHSFIRDRKKK